jgi:hypothetical protein
MPKLQLALWLSLTSSFLLPPCEAVPSLLCIPKIINADPPEVIDNGKQVLTTPRTIRVYYVNGHSEWKAKALVINGQVKTILLRGSQRPFTRSEIDCSGFGSGIDFRGMPWEFHGWLDP